MTATSDESWKTWDPAAKLRLFAALRRARWICDRDECDGMPHAGCLVKHARTAQREPAGEWRVVYLQGGRGAGKTRAGAEMLAGWILDSEPLDGDPGDWAIIAPTYGDARDVCVEGPSGLLNALGASVSKWNRSVGQLTVANGATVYCDGADDGALRIQGTNLRGVWCVAEGERIECVAGATPIEHVRIGDYVQTRRGLRRVLWAGRTGRQAPVLRIATGDCSVRVTGDHPVWVEGQGWTLACRVAPGDKLRVWSHHSPVLPHGTTGAAFAGIERATATTATEPAGYCTLLFGSEPTAGAYPGTGSFITTTKTWRTTTSETSSGCPVLSTPDSTTPGTRKGSRCSPTNRAVGSRANRGLIASRERSSVSAVASPTFRLGSGLSSMTAPAPPASTVVSVEPDGRADVYDLTVEGASEFYAGGILVHNCDEVGLWQHGWRTAWEESIRFAVRLDPAKIVTTGTPKAGHPLIRWLIEDEGTVIRRLRTLDNAANLNPLALEELMRLYAGKRLGRQELEAEYLEDVEGALWSREMLERIRIRPGQEPAMKRIVVAVDPNVSSEQGSNEAGIIVAGIGFDGIGYVLHDKTTSSGGPRAWAAAAVAAYHEAKADRIVAEKNNGGEMVELTIKTVDPYVPVKLVNASRGKRVRAEPVASLYEGDEPLVRHVGAFPELEDQLCTWTPEAESPDRMDALVWALTELDIAEPPPRALITVPKGRLRGIPNYGPNITTSPYG